VTLLTSNGSIRLTVGPGFNGAVTMDTSNASIAVRDPGGRITSAALKRSDGRVVVGTGGVPSRLRTSNGHIELVVDGQSPSASTSAQ
jgi:hypothetical protein